MHCCLLVLLPLLIGAVNHYEVKGTFSPINPEDVGPFLTNRAEFWPAENKIKQRLESVAEGLLNFIDHFEIHGEKRPRLSVVFHGYFSTDHTKESIEKLVEATADLQFYYLSRRDSLPLPSAPADVSDPAESCSNGGVLLPNATCACKQFYSGSSCEIVQCLHGGIQVGGRCSCPPGVATVNCEPRRCLPAVAGDFSRKQSSLILVINQDIKVAQHLMALLLTLASRNSSDVYNSFIVVSYLDSSKGFIMQKKELATYNEMLVYIEGISLGAGYDTQPTNEAILAAQSFASTMTAFSDVIVLTASPDSDISLPTNTASSQNSEDRLIFKSLAWRNRISYFIANTKGNFDSFHRVAKVTLGDVFYMDPADLNGPLTIFDAVLPTLPASEVVAWNFGTTAAMQITGTQYGNVTIFVTVKPGTDFPSLTDVTGGELQGITYKYNQVLELVEDKIVNVVGGGEWTVKALAPTTTTALLAYSDNEDVDIGHPYLTAGMDNYLTGQTIGFPAESLTSVEINSEIFDFFNITNDCSYPIRFGIVELASTGSYIQRLTFTDGQSRNNVRLIPGFGVHMDTVFRPSFQCFNGGTDNGDGTCSCPKRFNGSTDCGIPDCGLYTVNQFPGNGQGLCTCPQGVTGDFCDQAICYPSPFDQLGSTSRSLGVVIQASWSQAKYNDAIVSGLTAMLVNSFYDEYVLTTFDTIRSTDNDSSISNTTVFYEKQRFLSAVAGISYSASFATSLDVLGALDSALDAVRLDKSPIFLFLDALPANTTTESVILSHAVSKFAQINVIGSQAYGNAVNNLSYYQKYAFTTGGLYIDAGTSANETGTITQFLSLYGSVFTGTEVVSEQVPNNCTIGITDSVMLKSGNPTYFVINSATSTGFVVKINSQPATAISTAPTLGIYEIPSDLFDDPANNIIVEAQTNSGDDQCSWKIITKFDEVATTAFLPLGNTNFTRILNYGTDAYLPTVYSASNLTNTPGVQNTAITILSSTGQIVYSSNTEVTAGCSQQAPFTTSFGCASPNDQYIIKTVITLPNYTLQRSQRAYCYYPYGVCLNGGFWSDLAKECYCDDTYYGGTYCEVKKCQNNGTISNGHYEGLCSCPPGYIGEFCESRVCPNMNFMMAADAMERNYEQLLFVVNTNVDMLLVSIYLKSLVQNFTGDTADPSNPRQYTLVTFDETNVHVVSSTFDSVRFQNEFNSAMTNFSKAQHIPTRSLDAVHQAFMTVVQPSATIFLITGSNSSDLTLSSHILPKQRLGAQINLIYAQQGIVVPQQPSDPRLSPLARLTGGRILPLTQNSLNTFNKIVDEAFSEDVLVYDGGWEYCANGVQFVFTVETKATRIVLDITGDGVRNNISITDQLDTPTKYTTLFADTAAVILQIDLPTNIKPGSWLLHLKTNNGSCFLQVRAVSPIRVIPGFASIDADFDDFPISEPLIVDQQSRAVFRLSGDPGAALKNLEIVPMDNLYEPWTAGQSADWFFAPRDPSTCSYQYVSDSFTLNNGSFVKFIAHGTTSDGSGFSRTIYYELPMPDVVCELPFGQTDFATGACVCNDGYHGDDCSELLCQNEGSSSFGVCSCPTGYYGQFCEQYTKFNETTLAATTTTFSTTTTTAATTTASSTTPGTTTLGPCDPKDTTYYFSFFIDSTDEIDPNSKGVWFGEQHHTVLTVAANVSLSSGASETLLALSGVRKAFYPGGTVKDTNDIEEMFDTGNLTGPSLSVLDLTNAINFYLNSTTYSNVPNGKPGFAILFAQTQPDGDKEWFVDAIQRLEDRGYIVLGLIDATLSGILDPTDYFVTAMGAQNVYTMTNPGEGAHFINKRACQLKPS